MPKKKTEAAQFPPGKKPNNKLIKNSNPGALSRAFGLDPTMQGVQLSQMDTLWINNRWYLISNQRSLLNESYVEQGPLATAVDVPIDDALRGGVEIKTKQLEPEELEKLNAYMEEKGDLQIVNQAGKWKRLFGGAGIIVLTDQNPQSDFDINTVKKGSKVEFVAADLWELFWSIAQTNQYYAMGSISWQPDFFDYYGITLNSSRVMSMRGKAAPSLIRQKLRGWGLSIAEIMIRSINQYLKSTDLVFEVLDEFKIDVFKINNLVNSLQTREGEDAVKRRLAVANQQKNFQRALIMDKQDDYITKELSFAGISDTMAGIRIQLASDLRMPLSKLFGLGATGFSSGEDDIENYNAMVEGERATLKYPIVKMCKIRCAELFGHVPDDLSIEFKPLRILSSTQEEEVKNHRYNRAQAALNTGGMSMKEFKETCNKQNLLGVQLDVSDAALSEAEEIFEMQSGNAAKEVTGSSGKSTTDAPTAKNSMTLPTKFVATIGVVCDGKILTGHRRDNGKWTNPGGHIDGLGEDARAAACRELFEESGIEAQAHQLRPMPVIRIKGKNGHPYLIHPFILKLDEIVYPRTTLDPDTEVDEWRWVEISPATQELLPTSRHAAKDAIVEHVISKYYKEK